MSKENYSSIDELIKNPFMKKLIENRILKWMKLGKNIVKDTLLESKEKNLQS
ncbi:hypothetical protein N752_05680 [Desulforamulus aquiferis]|nr:hypothetical protein N752_05680 [Desulforamulus aquiferis]